MEGVETCLEISGRLRNCNLIGRMPHDWAVMLSSFVGRRGVSLERFQTFCLIAEAGSIMAAAKGDPNRQSLYSRQMKELEAALGLELLDRSEVPYRLTEVGWRLDSLAREFFSGTDRLLNVSKGNAPHLAIGAGESIFQWLIIPLLGGRLGGAEWRLQFRNMTSREAIEGVRSRKIDLAVVPAEDAAGDLESVKIASYGMVAVAKSGLFGKSKSARWADLRGRRLALLEGRGQLRGKIERLIDPEGSTPEIGLECTSHPQVIEACAVGDFIGLVPELAVAASKAAGLEVAKIGELAEIRIDLILAWSRSVADARKEVSTLIGLLTRNSGDSSVQE